MTNQRPPPSLYPRETRFQRCMIALAVVVLMVAALLALQFLGGCL